MSCWIVSPIHIDVLVTGLIEHGLVTESEAQETRNLLVRENAESYRYRYSHIPEAVREAESFLDEEIDRPWTKTMVRLTALSQAAKCYDYQACEHAAWENSPARRLMADLIVRLPERDDEPWGLDESNIDSVRV